MKTSYNYFKEYVDKYTENFEYGDSENEKFLENIVNYFFIGETTLDRNKGLMIRGSFGVGKTIILKIIQKMLQHDKKFAYNPANDVVAKYNIGGDEAIAVYKQKKERLFDDFGAEEIGKHFGNNVEVFQKIIYSRYDLLKYQHIRTHLTTNLSNEQIAEKYGERAYDRLKDMFNVINWNFKLSFRGKSKFRFKLEEEVVEVVKPLTDEEVLDSILFDVYNKAMLEDLPIELDKYNSVICFKKFYEKGLIDLTEEQKLKFKLRAIKHISIEEKKRKDKSNLFKYSVNALKDELLMKQEAEKSKNRLIQETATQLFFNEYLRVQKAKRIDLKEMYYF